MIATRRQTVGYQRTVIFIQSMLVSRGEGGPGAPPYDLKRHREVRGVATRRQTVGYQRTVISIQIALVSGVKAGREPRPTI